MQSESQGHASARERAVQEALSDLQAWAAPEDAEFVRDYLVAVLDARVTEIAGVLWLFLTQLHDYLRTCLSLFVSHAGPHSQQLYAERFGQSREFESLPALLLFYSQACKADRVVDPDIRFDNLQDPIGVRNGLFHGRIDLDADWKTPLYVVLHNTGPLRRLTASISRVTHIEPKLTYLPRTRDGS